MDKPQPPNAPQPLTKLQRQAQAWVVKYRAQVQRMTEALEQDVELHLDYTPPHFLKEPLRSAVLELIPEARVTPNTVAPAQAPNRWDDSGKMPPKQPNLLAQAALEIDAALRAAGRMVVVMPPPQGPQPLRATFVQGDRDRAKPRTK